MISLSPRRSVGSQSGFTIVEMMVALSISMVILLGFAVSFVNMKSTFNSQNSLLQLQDNERLAMTVLNTSIGEAGYFPNGSNLNASPAVPIQYVARGAVIVGTSTTNGGAMSKGSFLYGTKADSTSTPAKPETLSTAYASMPGDGLLTCQGSTNPSATAVTTLRNTFYVDATLHALMCEVTTGDLSATVVTATDPQPLISNVSSMSVMYGLIGPTGNIDRYRATANMAGADWDNVRNVKVTLIFINPNNAANPISWTQAINVMNNK